MGKPKKMHVAKEFTSYTLWTAPSNRSAGEKRLNPTVTKAMQEQFKKALAESQPELKKKLESFESVEISDAAARSLVK